MSAVSGTLLVASRPTMRQTMVWLKPWIRLPPLLVAAAHRRSVPTAVFAEWQPSAPAEENAARSLASAIWRKNGPGTIVRAQRARARYANHFQGGYEPSRVEKNWIAWSHVAMIREIDDKRKEDERNESAAKVIENNFERYSRKIPPAVHDSEQSDTEEALVDLELPALGGLIFAEQFLKRMD
jgi:hypothetical protein